MIEWSKHWPKALNLLAAFPLERPGYLHNGLAACNDIAIFQYYGEVAVVGRPRKGEHRGGWVENQMLLGERIPGYNDSTVVATVFLCQNSDPFAIVGPGCCVNQIRQNACCGISICLLYIVSAIGIERDASGSVPHLHALIKRTRSDVCTVGRPGNCADLSAVTPVGEEAVA